MARAPCARTTARGLSVHGWDPRGTAHVPMAGCAGVSGVLFSTFEPPRPLPAAAFPPLSALLGGTAGTACCNTVPHVATPVPSCPPRAAPRRAALRCWVARRRLTRRTGLCGYPRAAISTCAHRHTFAASGSPGHAATAAAWRCGGEGSCAGDEGERAAGRGRRHTGVPACDCLLNSSRLRVSLFVCLFACLRG